MMLALRNLIVHPSGRPPEGPGPPRVLSISVYQSVLLFVMGFMAAVGIVALVYVFAKFAIRSLRRVDETVRGNRMGARRGSRSISRRGNTTPRRGTESTARLEALTRMETIIARLSQENRQDDVQTRSGGRLPRVIGSPVRPSGSHGRVNNATPILEAPILNNIIPDEGWQRPTVAVPENSVLSNTTVVVSPGAVMSDSPFRVSFLSDRDVQVQNAEGPARGPVAEIATGMPVGRNRSPGSSAATGGGAAASPPSSGLRVLLTRNRRRSREDVNNSVLDPDVHTVNISPGTNTAQSPGLSPQTVSQTEAPQWERVERSPGNIPTGGTSAGTTSATTPSTESGPENPRLPNPLDRSPDDNFVIGQPLSPLENRLLSLLDNVPRESVGPNCFFPT